MVLPAGAAREPYKIDVVADGAVTELKITPKAASTMESAAQEPSRGFFQKIYDAIKWLFQKIFCCSTSSKEDISSDKPYVSSGEQAGHFKRALALMENHHQDINFVLREEGGYLQCGNTGRNEPLVFQAFRSALLLSLESRGLSQAEYRTFESEADAFIDFLKKHNIQPTDSDVNATQERGAQIQIKDDSGESLIGRRSYVLVGSVTGRNSYSRLGEAQIRKEYGELDIPNLKKELDLDLKFSNASRIPAIKIHFDGTNMLSAVEAIL